MLRRTLAAYPAFVFFGLLSSVVGDEGFPANLDYDGLPFFLSATGEKCPKHLDPLLCRYWDSFQNAITNSKSLNEPAKIIPENKTFWKEIPEDISQEGNSLEVPIADPGNQIHKRFTVFRRKSPVVRGYKRGPGFRSWGGKRDSLPLDGVEKRTKFASWGGKRDGEASTEEVIPGENTLEKRPKFQNWGGKKSSDDFLEEIGKYDKRGPIWKDRVYYLSEPFKKHVPKRPQFQSWGGKRTPYPWNDLYDYLHPKFLVSEGEKRKFSSWGGKRYDEYDNEQGDAYWGTRGDELLKRHAFRNWGGKRALSDDADTKESQSGEKTEEARDKRDAGRMVQISNLNSPREEGANSRR